MKLFRFDTRVTFCGILCALSCSLCTAMQMEPEDTNIIRIGQKVAAHQAWRSTNLADQQNIATIINGTAKDLGLFFKIRNQLKTHTATNNHEIQRLFTNIVRPSIRRKAAHLLQKAGIPRPVTLKDRALKILEERITTFAMDTNFSDLDGAERILQEILYSTTQESGEKQKGGNYLYEAIIAVANDPTQTEELEDLEARLKEVHQDFLRRVKRAEYGNPKYPAGKLEADQLSLCIDNIHTEARELQKKK